MAYSNAPDDHEVDQTQSYLSTLWSGTHGRMAVVDTYLNETYQVWLSRTDRRPAFRPPMARYTIDHAVDQQISVEPSITKMPAGRGEEHQTKADALEKPLAALWRDASMQEPSIPERQLFKHLLCYGYGVIGLEWWDEGKPKEPKRKQREDAKEFDKRLDGLQG